MDRRTVCSLFVAACAALAGCGSDDAGSDDDPDRLNDCADADFVTQAGNVTIMFGGSVGLSYSPRCVTINTGSTATFNGAFVAHPLRPGTNPDNPATGSPGNPITALDDGTTETFDFPAAGDYPYYCLYHYDSGGSGPGMRGVVRVK